MPNVEPENYPVLGKYIPIINEWLEGDSKVPRKKRHTATRIYKRLQEKYGYTGGYSSVKRYVKKKKIIMHSAHTGCLPIEHLMAYAQLDFGEFIYFDTNNTENNAYELVLSFPYSDKAFVQVFPSQNQECLFIGIKSTRQFITDTDYLGSVRIDIQSKDAEPTMETLYAAVFYVLGKIAASISDIDETYHGTKDFKARKVRDVFRDKTVNYTDPHDGGVDISQNDPSVNSDWKIDLSTKDWFVYTDNYGTSEEKTFVAYFSGYVADLRKIYNRIYLVRNEREFHIYSFENGERFEPDYVLFLQRDKTDGYEQLQIFIESKGTQLLEKDAWKEKFLLQLKTEAVPVTIFVDDNDYKILGLHFFNQDKRMAGFDSEFADLIGK